MKQALKAWPSLYRPLKASRYILLFLDYDGTLTPIVKMPEVALLSRKTRGLIKSLKVNKKFIVCLISGRSLADLKSMVGIEGITYVGNHGLELEGPDLKFSSAKAKKSRTLIRKIYNKLSTKLKSIAGGFLEDKGLSLTFHYRLVRKKDIPTAINLFDAVIEPYILKKEVRVNSGKKVLEVRPFVRWDKGKAAIWILKKYKERLKTNNILPIYMGDDRTDESAFEALGDMGVSIFVGKADSNTFARFFLENPREVGKFLGKLAKTSL